MRKENCTNEREHQESVALAKSEMLETERIEEMADVFRMLGEPSRLRIVLALTQGEMCVYHLVECCGGTQSGISHQLRVLKDNKIVKSRRVAQSIFYSIADEHVLEMVKIGLQHTHCV